ncbi:MAG: hypothetical protein EOP22_06720 [Hyphomicrobiales bacterium]|nr:MAG: hypothetical protein EOP22_06720 [Hyphomicrobiales bacterium]
MPVRLWLAVLLCLVASIVPAAAQARIQLHTSVEQGYGRLLFEFPGRLDLPGYRVNFDNNVLAVTFSEPVTLALPDFAATMPDYLTIGRVDPDGKGVRFGLRIPVTVHSMEAGERLFIDLLPANWQGLPPSLPPEVIAELTERAKNAAIKAEQDRKAAEAKALNPIATLRVGRNPTFTRVQFDWSVATEATFKQDGARASIVFDWPVDVDLYALKADLPSEIMGVANTVSPAGSAIEMTLVDGVVPRFYTENNQQFTLDIDLNAVEAKAIRTTAEQAARQAEEDAAKAVAAAKAEAAALAETDGAAAPDGADDAGRVITPLIDEQSGTIRVKFPFERDTASAVFRRGDTLWMLFDTKASINRPGPSEALDTIASAFAVIPAGDTQIVRVDLSTERLATLASEGRSWVLSVGDVLLNATEPLELQRSRDRDGRFQMTAALGKPSKVHTFRDPVVGDMLEVVTAFPPARGAVRDLSYVDFDALRSVHGLVVRPDNDELDVKLDRDVAVITTPQGLTLSDQDGRRTLDSGNADEFRDSFVDFALLREDNPAAFVRRREELSTAAAEREGQAREVARLNLAQYYVGNQFAQEAIGVLRVLKGDLKSEEMLKKVRLTDAIANVLASRPAEALATLAAPAFGDEVDAVMWRTIARAESLDYVGARSDALAAESVLDSYPSWVQQRFLFAAIRAAIETSDVPLAQKYIQRISFAQLDPEGVSLYQLMQARIAEAQGRSDEALRGYGQVIATDVRPTRAEAVYRTLLVMKATGSADLGKATDTLAAEAMLWRGNPLEVDMEKLLAELYFENKQYRLGFEITKQTAEHSPESRSIELLTQEAVAQFADLFLNGAADQLNDLEALSLYYDFRQLTPAGARGDEMIRNLARRLVRVDLLAQAADLLEYQIDSRLQGVAQAQVATDLALIRIADRNPEGALRALNRTRIANLAPTLERQRRILEARALIDAGREDLALDLLARLEGRDADLLRVDGYWKSKNYVTASGLIEKVYSTEGEPLSQTARMNIIKAAVGLVLADDELGISRIRSKFAERMAQTAEWGLFDYITSPMASPAGVEFKQAAKMVANLDSVTSFLQAYRGIYAVDQGLSPATASTKAAI